MGISCGGLVVGQGVWAVPILPDRARSAGAVAVALGGMLATVVLAGHPVSLAVTVQGVAVAVAAGPSLPMAVALAVAWGCWGKGPVELQVVLMPTALLGAVVSECSMAVVGITEAPQEMWGTAVERVLYELSGREQRVNFLQQILEICKCGLTPKQEKFC